jgi:hypothetical protein
MSKNFYENLNKFFLDPKNQEEIEPEYEVDISEAELDEEYNKVLPQLDKYMNKLDLSKYIN